MPKYRHVANVLRDQIRGGTLAADSPLPSEGELETRFGYDRGTIRRAIALLRREGLIATEQGRPATIRKQRLVTRDIAEGLRREAAAIDTGISDDIGVFRTLTGIDGDVTVQTDYHHNTPATPDLAEAFGIETGASLLLRRYAYRLDGRPYQILNSYLPTDLITGTILESKDQEAAGRGAMRQLADIGIRADRAEVYIRIRIVTPEESAALDIPEGDPVFATRRLLYADGQVVEVSNTVVPGDRLELLINVDLTGGQR